VCQFFDPLGARQTVAMSFDPSALPPSARRVSGILVGLGHSGEVTMLADSARTAAEAANALGCSVAEIAKSIVFRRLDDDAGVVVITSGDNRVDAAKVAALVGAVGKADADFVRSATGYAIGGVSPVGHPEGTVVVIDRDLSRFETIWAAAGHPHAVFPLTPSQLSDWLGMEPSDVRVD
jgi:prolyl-tRNA editing enzyme YbaK/EbsC (Cys-tRNA(Pro) deacylase)